MLYIPVAHRRVTKQTSVHYSAKFLFPPLFFLATTSRVHGPEPHFKLRPAKLGFEPNIRILRSVCVQCLANFEPRLAPSAFNQEARLVLSFHGH